MPRQEQGIEYYFTKAGEKRYRVRWEENGRHPSRSFRRLSGTNGARRFYQRIREHQEAGARIVNAREATLTLAVFVADVWAPRAKRRLAANSWQTVSQIYNKHILEALGMRPIAELDAEDLVEWQDGLERAGVGAPTRIKAASILSAIFREAARRTRSTGVTANPAALLDRPSAKRRRRPLVWGPVVVERVRYELLVNSLRINPAKELMALRDALLVSLMAMTGCRPQDALALSWADIESRIVFSKRLSKNRIVERTKNQGDRSAPLLEPLQKDLGAVRRHSDDGPLDQIFRKPESGEHYVETDWRNYRSRHFVPALQRVESSWEEWRKSLPEPEAVRESVAGLSNTRPYDLGRHTHSALMLASGMPLQRLSRIQGHSLRVLDETYSEQLAEYEERPERIDPVAEIKRARAIVWTGPLGA